MAHLVCNNCGNNESFIAKGEIDVKMEVNDRGKLVDYIDKEYALDEPVVKLLIKCKDCNSTDIKDKTTGETVQYQRILKATKEWIKEFNAIDTSIFKHIMEVGDSVEFLRELTREVITEGEEVYYSDINDFVEVIDVSDNGEKLVIRDGEGKEYEVDKNEVDNEVDSVLPMWNTMWSFSNSMNSKWAKDNVAKIKECGFRLYEYTRTGELYLGIDGAGYDFYSHHWVPLYKAYNSE